MSFNLIISGAFCNVFSFRFFTFIHMSSCTQQRHCICNRSSSYIRWRYSGGSGCESWPFNNENLQQTDHMGLVSTVLCSSNPSFKNRMGLVSLTGSTRNQPLTQSGSFKKTQLHFQSGQLWLNRPVSYPISKPN